MKRTSKPRTVKRWTTALLIAIVVLGGIPIGVQDTYAAPGPTPVRRPSRGEVAFGRGFSMELMRPGTPYGDFLRLPETQRTPEARRELARALGVDPQSNLITRLESFVRRTTLTSEQEVAEFYAESRELFELMGRTKPERRGDLAVRVRTATRADLSGLGQPRVSIDPQHFNAAETRLDGPSRSMALLEALDGAYGRLTGATGTMTGAESTRYWEALHGFRAANPDADPQTISEFGLLLENVRAMERGDMVLQRLGPNGTPQSERIWESVPQESPQTAQARANALTSMATTVREALLMGSRPGGQLSAPELHRLQSLLLESIRGAETNKSYAEAAAGFRVTARAMTALRGLDTFNRTALVDSVRAQPGVTRTEADRFNRRLEASEREARTELNSLAESLGLEAKPGESIGELIGRLRDHIGTLELARAETSRRTLDRIVRGLEAKWIAEIVEFQVRRNRLDARSALMLARCLVAGRAGSLASAATLGTGRAGLLTSGASMVGSMILLFCDVETALKGICPSCVTEALDSSERRARCLPGSGSTKQTHEEGTPSPFGAPQRKKR